jgi:hypothetical protein
MVCGSGRREGGEERQPCAVAGGGGQTLDLASPQQQQRLTEKTNENTYSAEPPRLGPTPSSGPSTVAPTMIANTYG